MSVGIIAVGACSPLGEGDAAYRGTPVGEVAERCVIRDEELAAAGLARPFAARVRMPLPESVDRATTLLEYAMTECARELDDVLPGWRSMRVGAAIGTSSGGMRAFESAVSASPSPLSGTYLGPLLDAARPCAFEPCSLILAACASSAIAVGIGRAWLDSDRCDIVLCGGFDAVSVFVAAGFASLRATCGALGPLPFREGRDGLALGEGAAIMALVPRERAGRVSRVRGWVTGFGASCDAMHLTAPDRNGEGLARAANAALADAGLVASSIGLISAHGTATLQNDAAEASAIRSVMGPIGAAVPVFALKGTTGHTLGAAGALEVLAAVEAMERGVCPASAGEGRAEAGVRVLDRSESLPVGTALKLASAFGGANAALIVSAANGAEAPRPARAISQDVYVSAAVAVTLADADPARLAARTDYGVDRLTRADDLVRLAIAAVAKLEDSGSPGLPGARLRGAGIVIGHGLATIETNALFLDRIRRSGAARAEPRRFAYTTPNAAAGECAVAFGLTGPAFAVGGGPHGGIEALCVAADLVRAGSAPGAGVVVVALDAAGDATRRLAPETPSGAVAFLVTGRGGVARLEGWTTRLERGDSVKRPFCPVSMDAHRVLLPLATGERPAQVTAELPWGGSAKASFCWL